MIGRLLLGATGWREKWCDGAQSHVEEMWYAPRMTGVDIDLDAHPGPQRRKVLVARVDTHAHRNTLDDFHPIAAGILRWQQRKLLRRRRADAFNRAAPFRIRIGIHRHRDRLTRVDIRQLGLLRIGVDPDMIGGDKEEGGRRGREVLPGAIDGTFVTMPANGAVTTEWAS